MYSPYVGRDYPKNVYFDDTHLHTNVSFDAYGDGNSKLGANEAYRFANVIVGVEAADAFWFRVAHYEELGLTIVQGEEQ